MIKAKKAGTKKTRKKRTPKVPSLTIKEKEVEWKYGMVYHVFVDPPKELIPTEKHIGKILEEAGKKPMEYVKLKSLNEENITVIDRNGATRAIEHGRVILHRDEKLREMKIGLKEMLGDVKSRGRANRKV